MRRWSSCSSTKGYADVHAIDGCNGRNACHHALAGGHLRIAQLLAGRGGDLALADHDGMTALGIAREHNNADAVALLEAAAQRRRLPHGQRRQRRARFLSAAKRGDVRSPSPSSPPLIRAGRRAERTRQRAHRMVVRPRSSGRAAFRTAMHTPNSRQGSHQCGRQCAPQGLCRVDGASGERLEMRDSQATPRCRSLCGGP